jgi:signal transduction histidine kinase
MSASFLQDENTPLWQRALLPSEADAASSGRTTRDWIVDTAVFAGAVVVGVFPLVDLWDSHGSVFHAFDVVVGSLACLSLWVRRARPVAVGVFAVVASSFFSLALGAALVAMFNTAVRARGRAVGGVAVLALAGSAVFPLVNPASEPFLKQRFPGFMVTAICFGWGFFVRVRRELIGSLRERAHELELEQSRNEERAREAERRRIAREMHDVLAHRLSLLSLQAGALELSPGAPAEEVAQAAAIRTSAAAALTELRDVIAVLREDTDGNLQPPHPTLAQLPSLLDECRAAGMKVRAHIDVPDVGAVPEALGRTAYRVVQEGLTNARKHAPGAAASVSVAHDEQGRNLVVEVVSGSSPAAMPTDAAGAGLVGLAERLSLVGGHLEHGRDAGGDFVLRATLPWPA